MTEEKFIMDEAELTGCTPALVAYNYTHMTAYEYDKWKAAEIEREKRRQAHAVSHADYEEKSRDMKELSYRAKAIKKLESRIKWVEVVLG